MTFSVKRMYAIFQKDLKDFSKNMYIGSILVLPIILAAIYGRMEDNTMDSHYMVINLTFAAVTAFIQCALIAEEKEKNTLRGLMLSPASLPEILGGKSLVTLLITLITIVICAWLTGYEPANILPVAIAIILSSFFYIALGTLFGLLTKSVMEASVVMLPVLFIFGFGSMLQMMIDKYPILAFVDYMPNTQLIEMAEKAQAGSGLAEVWIHIGAIAIWFAATAIITAVVFKKRELDE